MKRLADKYIALYIEQLERLTPQERMMEEPWGQALQELRERRAVDDVRRAETDELVRRRNADLSSDEVEALRQVAGDLRDYGEAGHYTKLVRHYILDALDKIIAVHGAKP